MSGLRIRLQVVLFRGQLPTLSQWCILLSKVSGSRSKCPDLRRRWCYFYMGQDPSICRNFDSSSKSGDWHR